MTNQNQDAIKVLRKMETKLSEHLTGCMEEDVEIVEKLDAIDTAINSLQQDQKTGSWIPVSKKLPKESGRYLVTFGKTYLVGEDFYTTEEDARRIFEEPEEYIGWRSCNVVAWMPLPYHI